MFIDPQLSQKHEGLQYSVLKPYLEVIRSNVRFKTTLPKQSEVDGEQCDQIGRFIALRTIFQSLWQQLICPNLLPFLGNFCKGGKIIHFSREINFWQLL